MNNQVNPKAFVILALLAFGMQGCGEESTFSSSEQQIINGVEDHSPEHQAVVMMRSADGRCTGTLIAPPVVLTAAHCADDGTPADYVVLFGDEWNSATPVPVSEFIFHPDYDPVKIEHDIAMLRLAAPAPAGVAPIPHLPQSLELTQADIGTDLLFVGFGITRYGGNDYGVKRRVTLPLYHICNSLSGCQVNLRGTNYPTRPNSISYDQADRGTCMGDSGGPAFIMRDGQKYVAGVNSIVWGECNLLASGTKVDAYEQWINDFIGSFTLNGQVCTNDAQCYSGFCVDGVCCESACDQPCMTCAGGKTDGLCVPEPDGSACDDGDPCNGPDTCQAGQCVPGNSPPDCTSPNPCLVGRCEPGIGCVFDPVEDGTACDNGNVCDGEDRCVQGNCTPSGPALDCDDGNPCTGDECNPVTGCANEPVQDGTPCDDEDLCNGGEVCQAGQCVSSEPLDCDDANACTEDTCDPSAGCVHTELPEGSNCGEGRTCQRGLCLPAPSGGCGCASNGKEPAGGISLVLVGLLFAMRRKKQ